MKLRTFTALLLAAIMLFALTACGSQAADDSSSDQQQEQQDTTTNESNEFRVGMECAYAPNNWQESEATDSNVPVENVAGTYAEGYDVQIAKAIADGLGKELVIVKLSWDGLIDALNQGQIDAIIAGMMDSAERRESINFSDPYRETTYGLMVLADSPYLNATSIQDFSGAAVLGQQGTALDDVIEQIEGVDHLSPVGSVPDMISRLQQGTCDAITYNTENTNGFLRANPDLVAIQFEKGKGFKETPDRVLTGGPMMGIAQYNLDVTCIKGTNAVLCLTKKEAAPVVEEETCLRCARCVNVCPMHLTPVYMHLYAEKGMWKEAEALNVMDCIECGSCAYGCPAGIPLVQSFRTGKKLVRDAAAREKAKKEAAAK